jgi:hypothetical protein
VLDLEAWCEGLVGQRPWGDWYFLLPTGQQMTPTVGIRIVCFTTAEGNCWREGMARLPNLG